MLDRIKVISQRKAVDLKSFNLSQNYNQTD